MNTDCKQFYEEYHKWEGPSSWRSFFADFKVDNIIRLCKRDRFNKVLEIGCGDGAILEKLSIYDFADELYGVDISKNIIEIAKKRNIKNIVELKEYDGYHLDYTPHMFDLVILSHVLEHVEFPRQLLKETLQVGKYFIFEVPLEKNLYSSLLRMQKNNYAKVLGHINFWDRNSFRKFIVSCGFVIQEEVIWFIPLSVDLYNENSFLCKTMAFLKHFLKAIVRMISVNLYLKLFTVHYAVLCRKGC